MVEHEYAKALYELAIEVKQQDKIDGDLFDLISIFNTNEDFKHAMVCKSVNRIIKKEIIKNALSSFSDLLVDFLYVLADNNRFSILEGIQREYHNLISKEKNIMYFDVYTCDELNKKQQDKISGMLKEKYPSKTIKINNVVDNKLIGGIKILFEGQSLDLSLKYQLDSLKATL